MKLRCILIDNKPTLQIYCEDRIDMFSQSVDRYWKTMTEKDFENVREHIKELQAYLKYIETGKGNIKIVEDNYKSSGGIKKHIRK